MPSAGYYSHVSLPSCCLPRRRIAFGFACLPSYCLPRRIAFEILINPAFVFPLHLFSRADCQRVRRAGGQSSARRPSISWTYAFDLPETIVAIESSVSGLLCSKCQKERRTGVFNAPLVNRQVLWHEVAIVCNCHQERRVGVHQAPLVSRQVP